MEKRKSKRNLLTIGTFNVRGLTQQVKMEQLSRDLIKYGVDICALQETKIIKGIDTNINRHRLISLQTDQRAYGNGFMIAPRIVDHIHRYWKVSDRISILQINMDGIRKPNISQPPTFTSSLKGMKMIVRKQPPKRLLNIINVYAPTTERVKHNMKELDDLYRNLSDIVNNFRNQASSITIIAGDINAKVCTSTGFENCLGQFSRGRRNNSGETLTNFCDINDLFISNSAFQHPARHITTCVTPYKDKATNKIVKSYTQIDYIITPRNKKHILVDSRSYAGTEVSSDHRLIVT